jgi:hypothetical protein
MAKNRGGFGSGGFASGGPQNRNQPTTTAPVRGAAARPNKIGRRDNKRSGLQSRRQTQRDNGTGAAFMDPPDVNQLDTETGSIAFNADKNLELGAWGVLNNAGISRDPGSGFGGNAIPWMEDRVQAWADQHRGNLLVNNKDALFETALSQHAGVPGTVPGTVPGAAGDPLGFKPWLRDERGMGRHAIQGMSQNKRKKLKNKHGDYVDNFGAEADTGGAINSNAAPLTPEEQAMFRNTLTRDWAAATPQTRGYRSSDWVAPKRVIQF